MKLTKELEKIIGNKDFNYELWYCDRDKMIKRCLIGEGEYLPGRVDIKQLKKDIEFHKVDGRSAYFFKFPRSIYLVIVFEDGSIDLDTSQIEGVRCTLLEDYMEETIDILEKEKNILLDTVKAISEESELEDVLNNILDGALRINAKAEAGFIQLYDPKVHALKVEAAKGYRDDIYDFEPKVGESVTGTVFMDGKSRYCNTREEIFERNLEKKLSERNREALRNAIDYNRLNGVVSVPINYKDKKLGVMTVHNMREDVEFDDYDVRLLESFASKAAISIQNTLLIMELNENLEETKRMNSIVSMKNKVYRDLTKLSLMNKGIAEMVNTLSIMTETPMILYNKIKTEIQFNNLNILESEDELIRQILEYEKKDTGLSQGEQGSYYFYPIKNGSVFLGYLITGANISDEYGVRMVLEEGILALTLELVKNYVLEDIIFKRTHEYFTKLLTSTDRREVENYRQKLGLPVDEWYLSIIVGINNYKDLQVLEMDTHNIISSLKKEFVDEKYLIYGFHNKINLILHSEVKEDVEEIKAKLNGVLNLEKQIKGTDLSIGIGTYYFGVDNVAKSYKEAEMALSYITPQQYRSMIEYNEIGINRLFINHMPGDMNQFLGDVLGELETEEARKSNLEETLFTYIETNKSAVETADRLHIHINTFYNRLKKIEKILDVNFDDPEDNLKIQLAVHLKKNKENIIM